MARGYARGGPCDRQQRLEAVWSYVTKSSIEGEGDTVTRRILVKVPCVKSNDRRVRPGSVSYVIAWDGGGGVIGNSDGMRNGKGCGHCNYIHADTTASAQEGSDCHPPYASNTVRAFQQSDEDRGCRDTRHRKELRPRNQASMDGSSEHHRSASGSHGTEQHPPRLARVMEIPGTGRVMKQLRASVGHPHRGPSALRTGFPNDATPVLFIPSLPLSPYTGEGQAPSASSSSTSSSAVNSECVYFGPYDEGDKYEGDVVDTRYPRSRSEKIQVQDQRSQHHHRLSKFRQSSGATALDYASRVSTASSQELPKILQDKNSHCRGASTINLKFIGRRGRGADEPYGMPEEEMNVDSQRSNYARALEFVRKRGSADIGERRSKEASVEYSFFPSACVDEQLRIADVDHFIPTAPSTLLEVKGDVSEWKGPIGGIPRAQELGAGLD